MAKGVLSQGTHVWILHGATPSLTRILCIKSIAWGDDSSTEIDTTCLDEEETKTSDFGLVTPGEGSLVINTDPTNATHMTLLQLADDRDEVGVYVGWSDGPGVPTLTGSDVTLPDTRSWSYATVKLRKNSPVFDPDALVNHSIPLKRQTKVIEEFKVTP